MAKTKDNIKKAFGKNFKPTDMHIFPSSGENWRTCLSGLGEIPYYGKQISARCNGSVVEATVWGSHEPKDKNARTTIFLSVSMRGKKEDVFIRY